MADKTNNSADLLVVGELNMDLILNKLEAFPELGKEKVAKDYTLTMGSSSAIFAANCSRLGLSVKFSGLVGDDEFGDKIQAHLQDFGIDNKFVVTSKKFKTGLTTIFRYNNDRAMITYPGAMEHFSLSQIPGKAFQQVRHLHISSIFLQPGIKDDLYAIISRAKKQGMSISIDPQWDPDEKWNLNLKKLLPKIDFFLPNEQEFLKLTNASSIEKGIKKLQPLLNNTSVIIKMGKKGATYFNTNEIQKVSPHINENPVDTVGAGDSFGAGFIFKYLKEESIKNCVKFGNLTGAVSTTEAGGTQAIKSLKRVEQIAKQKLSK